VRAKQAQDAERREGGKMTAANMPVEKPIFDLSVMEKVVIQGDLSMLNPQERLVYYTKVCESLGLNPLTKPFDYLMLDGKLVLYAKRDATDQLRKLHKVSITITNREKIGDVYCVTARGTTPDGRTDEAIGAVPLLKEEKVWDAEKYNSRTQKKGAYVSTGKLIPLDANELANALMKAEAKAKRRVTLSLVGLGMMDETEIETVDGAHRVVIDDQAQPELPERTEVPEPSNESEQPKDAEQTSKQQRRQSSRRDAGSAKATKTYRLLDMNTGTSPQGITYAKMLVVDPNGEKMLVLAKDEAVLEKTSELRNDSQFELDIHIENGFNIVKSIRVLDPVS
jgi:hypothetical protein